MNSKVLLRKNIKQLVANISAEKKFMQSNAIMHKVNLSSWETLFRDFLIFQLFSKCLRSFKKLERVYKFRELINVCKCEQMWITLTLSYS